MLDMEEDEFEVVPWFHNGKKYNVNPVDNYIYDINTIESAKNVQKKLDEISKPEFERIFLSN